MSEGPYNVVDEDIRGGRFSSVVGPSARPLRGGVVIRYARGDRPDAEEYAANLNRAHAAALASSKPSPAFVAMRTAIQYIMGGVANTQKLMPGGRDVLLNETWVRVNTQYLIKARSALALAEKETGK